MLLACLAIASAGQAGAQPSGAAELAVAASTAVIAVLDGGINPYHIAFRDASPRAQQHPATYIPGYPPDARPLNLTLDAPSWTSAVVADCAVWKSVQPGQLYWIPGTKVVGAITFHVSSPTECQPAFPGGPARIRNVPLLDLGGHGTMAASRAAALEYGGCRECRIVAAVMSVESLEWAANNAAWIDLSTNSWSPTALWPLLVATRQVHTDPETARRIESAAQKHLVFFASMNGFAHASQVPAALPYMTLLDPDHTPSVILVGGHDSGSVTTWPGIPAHVVSDSCWSWAAAWNSLDISTDRIGTGTSAATPFAAGSAAEILIEARRILGDTSTGVDGGAVARGPAGIVASGPLADGILTLSEWKRLVLTSATPRPTAQYEDGPACPLVGSPYVTTPLRWADVPPTYPEFVQIGYGAVDRPAISLAKRVLQGEIAMPDRSATDAYFAADHAVREQMHEKIWSEVHVDPSS